MNAIREKSRQTVPHVATLHSANNARRDAPGRLKPVDCALPRPVRRQNYKMGNGAGVPVRGVGHEMVFTGVVRWLVMTIVRRHIG